MAASVFAGKTTARFGGSTPRLTATGKPTQGWKAVKNLTTRITVIRRFGRKYCNKSFQCTIAPGLTVGSSQTVVSRVQDLIEKSNPNSESLATKKQPAGSAPTKGALSSPFSAPAKKAPNQKIQKQQNGEGFLLKARDLFKDNRALSPLQVLLALFSFQIVVQILEDNPDEFNAGLVVTVTVIVLAQGMEGTTVTNDLVRGLTLNVPKGLLLSLLICMSNVIGGADAQDDSEDGALEYPNEGKQLPHYVKAAAGTLLAVLIAMIAARAVERINRRRLIAGASAIIPPPAAAPAAAPAPGLAPPIVPAVPVPVPVLVVPVPHPAPPADFIDDVLSDLGDPARLEIYARI